MRPGATRLGRVRGAIEFERRLVRLPREARRRSTSSRFGSRRARRWRSSAPAAPASRRSRSCWFASTTPTTARSGIDGHDLRDVSMASLRENVSILFQEALVLRGTVAENIAFGRPGASREEIEAAARPAGAAGVHRALCRDGSTPTSASAAAASPAASASGSRSPGRCSPTRRSWCSTSPRPGLDAEARERLLGPLRELMRDRTTIVVSHDLLTVRDADRIAVLDRGRLVELGAHDELLGAGGLYSRLWELHRTARASDAAARGPRTSRGRGEPDRRRAPPPSRSRRRDDRARLRGDRAPAPRQRPRRLRRLERRARRALHRSRRCAATAPEQARGRAARCCERGGCCPRSPTRTSSAPTRRSPSRCRWSCSRRSAARRSRTLIEEGAELGAEEVAHLGLHLGSAVRYLHRHGVLHLDLKPSNVIAEAGRAKLIDLSVARASGPGATRGSAPGTTSHPSRRAAASSAPPPTSGGSGRSCSRSATGEAPFDDDPDAWEREPPAARAPTARPRPGALSAARAAGSQAGDGASDSRPAGRPDCRLHGAAVGGPPGAHRAARRPRAARPLAPGRAPLGALRALSSASNQGFSGAA